MPSVVTAIVHVRDRAIHCVSCENRIARILGRLDGVLNVRASSQEQTVTVVVDGSGSSLEQVRAQLAKAGYPVTDVELPA